MTERTADEFQGQFERIGLASVDIDHWAGHATVELLMGATDSAHSKPFLLDCRRARHIDGPTCTDSLPREREQPLHLLPAA